MYQCALCQAIVPPRTARLLLTRYRPARYPQRENAHRYRREGRALLDPDRGGVGREIAAELPVCAACHARGTKRCDN